MNKQEETREGIKRCYTEPVEDFGGRIDTPNKMADYVTDKVLAYLHSQGVVIKVKCPDCSWAEFAGEESVGMTPCYRCNSTGCITKPLIE